jgi:hypothetical protein
MRILHLFSFLLFVGVGIAKTNDSKATQYGKLIYEAETLITEEKYQEAVTTYDKAYRVNNYMFAIDIENSLIANIQIKDWEKAAFWSEKLMLKGVEKNFFDSNRFVEFRKTSAWNKLLSRYNDIRTEFKKGYNQVLVDELTALLEEYNSENEQPEINTVEVLDSITDRFIKLIQTYGFPSEEKIGVYVYDHFNLSEVPAIGFDIWFWDSDAINSSLHRDDILTSIAEKAIEDLLLRESVYYNSNGANHLNFVLVGDNIYENPNFAGPEKKEKINLLRKKIVFKNTKNKAGFNFYTPLSIFGGAELEGEEWFMSEHIFLVKHQP